MFEMTCTVCQDTFETDNEDEMVMGICQDCQEFGADYMETFATDDDRYIPEYTPEY